MPLGNAKRMKNILQLIKHSLLRLSVFNIIFNFAVFAFRYYFITLWSFIITSWFHFCELFIARRKANLLLCNARKFFQNNSKTEKG